MIKKMIDVYDYQSLNHFKLSNVWWRDMEKTGKSLSWRWCYQLYKSKAFGMQQNNRGIQQMMAMQTRLMMLTSTCSMLFGENSALMLNGLGGFLAYILRRSTSPSLAVAHWWSATET